jgi:hypothetical protein
MNSKATHAFWRLFDDLPAEVQEHARQAYRLWAADPSHPSIHFKRVSRKRPIYSARIGLRYRALGRMDGDTITWFWIGPHDEYDRLL